MAGQVFAAATAARMLRRHAMACVALPTCPLAMAESERYLPDLNTKLPEWLLPLSPRLAFPVADRANTTSIWGGGLYGQRLGRLYLENVGEETILNALAPLFQRFAKERNPGERFGDFLIRAGLVREVHSGPEEDTAREGVI
jgi:sulfite reductase (NADPH) hemoprotein beta-component